MKLYEKLPGFKLLGTDGQQHTLSEERGINGLVVIFTCNHCPYARAYIDRIANITAEYAAKGFGFVAISSNDAVQYPQDAFEHMKPMAKELGLADKYLYDESQQAAKDFGAQRTPEVYLFNKEDKLVYQGAIDDNWQNALQVETHYLKNALNALLEEQDIATKETPAVGCSIKWKM